jgi:rhamnopyranosyl-N-acetylglucosaminyl-diphospho-decaprenol beta-1,3/1,4-galactofuranosyltransferase
VVVQHTLKGLGDLARGFRANRALWRDDTWRPMDPADVPALGHSSGGPS